MHRGREKQKEPPREYKPNGAKQKQCVKLGKGTLDMLVLFLQCFHKFKNKIKTKIYKKTFLKM